MSETPKEPRGLSMDDADAADTLLRDFDSDHLVELALAILMQTVPAKAKPDRLPQLHTLGIERARKWAQSASTEEIGTWMANGKKAERADGTPPKLSEYGWPLQSVPDEIDQDPELYSKLSILDQRTEFTRGFYIGLASLDMTQMSGTDQRQAVASPGQPEQ